MHPEDRLDALLTAQLRAPRATAVEEPGDLAPLVEAAQRLGTLRRAEPARDFARALEQRLLARAELVAARPVRGEARELPVGGRSRRGIRQRMPRAPRWAPLAAAALLLLVISAGTLTAAASAAPGTPLYGLHRMEQGMRAQLAGSAADRGYLHIAYADQALSALVAAAAQHDMRAYQDALATMREELAAARAAVGQVPAGQAHDALDAALARLTARAQAALLAALPHVEWPACVATTSVLGELGQPIPVVSGARVLEQNRGGQVVWLITITGSGFQAGARVVLDGQVVGGAVTMTPEMLRLTLASPPATSLRSIGVQNPDGTAAETRHITVVRAEPGKDSAPNGTPTSTSGTGHSGQGGGDKNGGHAPTPSAAPTHSPGAH
jgi:hypothetical protein